MNKHDNLTIVSEQPGDYTDDMLWLCTF